MGFLRTKSLPVGISYVRLRQSKARGVVLPSFFLRGYLAFPFGGEQVGHITINAV